MSFEKQFTDAFFDEQMRKQLGVIPIRIQCKRTKGWKMPPNTVYVGRGSVWANPYRVTKTANGCWKVERTRFEPTLFEPNRKLEALKLAVNMFGIYMQNYHRVKDLRGKNLACWCPLDQPCHADVLLELANK